MKIKSIVSAALTGLAIAAIPVAPPAAQAETVRVLREGASGNLSVSMNRAIVVESEVPFAELSIANPAIADFSTLSDRTIYVLGKTPGRTTLSLFDGTGQLITNLDVHVNTDISEFKERLRQILPGEPIEVRTANDGIVLSGTVSSSARLQRALDLAERYAPERVSNLMSVSGKQQVMLKVRFAEMQRSVSKALSTSLAVDGIGATSGTGGGFVGSNLSTGQIGGGAGDVIVPGNLGGNTAQGTAFFGFDIGSVEVGILLEALETKGVVRTLAEPNLTALSGQEATFLAGGEFPIPVAQDNDTTTIEFKPFGVELNFIPRVVDEGIINLEIDAAVSSVDTSVAVSAGGINVPAFRRRDTSTTVSMRDGESFAIAGLLQDDFRDNNAQVPWLGDVPVLGALFRSADYERSQTELVIIISAHLVSPTRGEALALPTDRVRLPTDGDLFLNGRVARGVERGGAVGEVAKQDFTGSYGYVMD
ncbi:type II secretion system protein D precursor [Roseovarius sp. A-2]|uniref:type II and III secretion system protein family protein n=1 Tax=Roseovarius sp. A-2 TaxID=1570360 RepID=UPI0009B55011|nr:type II and III secretion system protein family protein [Roseovarius sp. A-2]GAW34113.1 type II secretion system protein D precursor [Roseovarius sp. A-2]